MPEVIYMKRDKSLTVGLVLCFVVIIAIAGVVTFRKSEEKPKNELAQTDEKEEYEEPAEITQSEDVEAEIVIPSESVEQIIEQAEQYYFADSDLMQWPIAGNVLMNYSMDQTIYFATLEQYKYNPALLIEGKEGENVVAAKAGKVTKVEETAETGTTVTIDMGNGYEAVYGQLQDLQVTEGDLVKAGDVLGNLAKPSRYYSVEGCNLYFQLLKNGEPINPMDFLEP